MGDYSTAGPLKSLQKLYLDRDYDAFIQQLLEEKGILNEGVFHYNLGVAYFKKEQLAVSRFHFEKALAKGYYYPGIFKNLDVVNERLGVDALEQSRYVKDNILNQALEIPRPLYISTTLALLAFFVLLFRFNKIKRAVLIFSLTISLLPLAGHLFLEKNYQRAIVLHESQSHEGPSESFDTTNNIPAGIGVIVRKNDSSWHYIIAPTHLGGWIARKQLGIL